jgi:hypothetical protein
MCELHTTSKKSKENIMKVRKFFKKINTMLNWLFNPAVLAAINEGCTYEEVERIAEGRKE